jgi:hypothetical protein
VSHPSLGLPPPDRTAGYPAAAARVRSDVARLAGRALRVAMDADPSIRTRYTEAGLRLLLHDAELLAERVALSLDTDTPSMAHDYAEWTAPVYRRRGTPMNDLIRLCDGLRASLPSTLAPAELASASDALGAAIAVYRWHRRIAGDHKRNPILQLLYKGA